MKKRTDKPRPCAGPKETVMRGGSRVVEPATPEPKPAPAKEKPVATDE